MITLDQILSPLFRICYDFRKLTSDCESGNSNLYNYQDGSMLHRFHALMVNYRLMKSYLRIRELAAVALEQDWFCQNLNYIVAFNPPVSRYSLIILTTVLCLKTGLHYKFYGVGACEITRFGSVYGVEQHQFITM
ncbi:hypothetical protein UY3_00382 [Chelonia mydas]|uniref:Uncharacterized protein n=1 Tax=Chelonia mydas TaxID=8469 RepID=M7CCC7_CHEMY|nr:hypothetical protein UY3_00382 [Chelonia mydas]